MEKGWRTANIIAQLPCPRLRADLAVHIHDADACVDKRLELIAISTHSMTACESLRTGAKKRRPWAAFRYEERQASPYPLTQSTWRKV